MSFIAQLKDVFGFTNLEQNLLFLNSVQTQVDTFIYHQVYFQPRINGTPVLDAGITVYINKKGEIYLVNAAAYRFSAPFDRAETLLTSEAAKAVAMLNIEQPVVFAGEVTTKLGYVYKNDSYILVWRVRIPTSQPLYNWQLDITQDGTVINKTDLTLYATGTARVYLHHPLVGDTVRQSLYNLRDDSCYVVGTYANVYNLEGPRACDSNWQFIYDTSDARFDEGNVYYHVQFFVERLVNMGLDTTLLKRRIRAVVRAIGPCGGSYTPNYDTTHPGGGITYGRGGDSTSCRDGAKEEVTTYHEYGHALVDRLIEPEESYWFPIESEGMNEGLADYFAFSASNDTLIPEWTDPDHTRNAENNQIYPDSLGGGPHEDGEIISGALWNMRKLMLQMNEGMHPDKLVWLALDHTNVVDRLKRFRSRVVMADRDFGNSDNLRAIHFGFESKTIPANDTLTPPTNPDVITPYFSPPVSTVYEGNCYQICTDATQNGAPAATLDYYWKSSKGTPLSPQHQIDVCMNYCPPVRNQTRVDSIWVWVYDGLGGVDSAVKVVTIYPQPPQPPGPGCPYLYTWDGTKFVQDNTILTQSEFNPLSTTVTDHYQLTQPLIEKDGEYLLQLKEFENEETQLDQVELITVDYPPTVRVGVTPEGKVLAYDKVLLPVSCTDNEGNDRLELITSRDSMLFEAKGPGYLLLTFNNPKDKKLSNYLRPVTAVEPDAPPPCGCDKRIGVNNRLVVEIEDYQGHWHTLGDIAPRANADKVFWVLGSTDVQLGEQFRVKLSWNIDYEADWLAFFLPTEQTWYQESIKLKTAVHSNKGDISVRMATADGNSSKLVPGESIYLKFPVGASKSEGMVRDFVFKAVGYYKKYDKVSTTGAFTYKLHNNYPNPFNAVTEIQYALPEPSEVNLSVYNIMGQKVRTLVEDRQSAGVHKVTWDGKNEKGETVASGVYFYSIKAGTYVETKKMTLLK